MGTTSLTFQVSGVSELLGYIDRIQSKMAGLDQSMSKAQLSTEMSRVERLLKEAGTFANTLYTALQKVENTNVQKTKLWFLNKTFRLYFRLLRNIIS